MKYGYVRISTDDPHLNLQLTSLKQAGCDKDFVYEGRGGANLIRPALQRSPKQLEHGNTLTVRELDRLRCSVRDVVNTLHDLTSRGVQLQSLTEQIDTTHPLGQNILHMLALLAELERELKFGAKPKTLHRSHRSRPSTLKPRQSVRRSCCPSEWQPLYPVASLAGMN